MISIALRYGPHSRPSASARSTLQGVDAHAEFHRILLARCPSMWLLRFTAQLADASPSLPDRVRRRRRRATPPRAGNTRRSATRAIAGDIDACAALQEQHLRRTLQLVSAVAQGNGESRAHDRS